MIFAAGIDGGGTKTKVECRTPDGEVLCRQTFGPFNLNSIGEERFAALLEEIAAFLAQTGTCEALCAGAAGISNPRVRALFEETMERAGIRRWRLVGDHEIALHGALSGAPGCALIAGTGSICCGKNAAGEFARAGGWGHLIDDGGSGYALGRDAASAAVREWDGRGEATALTGLIAEALRVDTPQALTAYVYSGDKSRLAALAPLVGKAAARGDSCARRIYEQNGAELAALVGAVAKRLGLTQCRAALLGGLLEHDQFLRAALTESLAASMPGIECVPPEHDALSGAAMMALELLRES